MERTLQVLNALERDGVVSRYAIGGAMAATFYAEPVLTQLAALPFPHKVRLVIQMQQMAAPILHRLVYQVPDDIKTVKILRMWTHYE